MTKLSTYLMNSSLIIGLLLCASLMWAQETSKATIKIIKNVNGQTTVIDTTIELGSESSVDAILEQLGVNDSNSNTEGDIDIDVDVHIDGNGEGMKKKKRVIIIDEDGGGEGVEHMIKHFDSDGQMHKEIMNLVQSGSCEDRPFLGVMIKMDGEETKVDGLYVDDVAEGGAAQKAGMQAGDVLTHFNGEKLKNFEHLGQLIKKQKIGDQIEVSFVRDGATKNAGATLGTYENDFKYATKQQYLKKDCCANSDCCKDKKSDKAFLGIYPDENEDVAGVKVTKVVPQSAAEQVGLQAGDVITALNGKAISNLEDLRQVLKGEKIGNNITIAYTQGGDLKVKSAALTANLEQKTSKKDCCANKQSCHKEEKAEWHQKKKFDNGNKAFLGVLLKESVEKTVENGEETTTTNQPATGVLVTDVIENSAAKEAGLEGGDVITAINGTPTNDLHTLVNEIGKYGVDEVIEVSYLRNGQPQTAQAKLKGNGEPKMSKRKEIRIKSLEDLGELKNLEDLDIDINIEDLGNANVIIKRLEDIDMKDLNEKLKEMNIDVDQLDGELEILEDDKVQSNEMTWTKKDGKTITIKTNVWITDLEEEDASLVEDQPVLEEAMAAEKANPLAVDALKFFPNPSNGQFEVSFNLPERGDAVVRVLDIAGKEVFRNNLAAFSGNYREQIDISDNTKGVYFLQISQNGKVLNKKIMVQ